VPLRLTGLVKIDATHSFNITSIMLFFAITATITCVLIIGISIYILFPKYIPFYSSIKVFIVIAYRAYITFIVLAFTFLEIARK